MNIRVYIDGFNLYYGALKDRPEYKWLDLVKLSQKTALEFLPANQDKIEIHYGSFRYRPFTAKLVNIPIANNNIVRVDDEGGCVGENIRLVTGDYEVNSRILPVRLRLKDEVFANAPKALSVKASKPEEKRTDVNIACHLLNDAWKNLFDAAIIISNDSYLMEPIKMVIKERGKPVYVMSPQIGKRVAEDLTKHATGTRHMRTSMLRGCLLPDNIPGTNIRRPIVWNT